MDPRHPTPADVLEELVNALRASITPITTPLSASASPMAISASYSGEAVECSGFLLQVALFIEMQPQKFPTEQTKVAFMISLLTGRALLWARAIWKAQSTINNSFNAFANHFKEVFGSTTGVLSIPTSFCSCVRALLLPVITRSNSARWRQLAVGMRPHCWPRIVKGWIRAFERRWLFMMTQWDRKALCSG